MFPIIQNINEFTTYFISIEKVRLTFSFQYNTMDRQNSIENHEIFIMKVFLSSMKFALYILRNLIFLQCLNIKYI